MCGIVAGIAQRNVVPILIEGLHRLEYRGYDSAGLAVRGEAALASCRAVGKVAALEQKVAAEAVSGQQGIAHTRWATHGEVSEINAHPQMSGERVAVVHNGIIENYEELRDELAGQGYSFVSQTDTEVIAHLIAAELDRHDSLIDAVAAARRRLRGAYGMAVMAADHPEELVVARMGSPLVLGIGIGEHFAASDVAALLPVTHQVVYLEEGDLAVLTREAWEVRDAQDQPAQRRVHEAVGADAADKGEYRHFMLKEIYEQPRAVADTLEGRISAEAVLPQALGPRAEQLLGQVQHIHIVACGTSFHAGLVARYWIESMAGVPVSVELASEYRYRDVVVPPDSLFITLSQSGETADTLAALRYANAAGYLGSLTICNSPQSSMVRESDLVMMTRAGPEVGVASTKAFTTQLVSMLLVSLLLGALYSVVFQSQANFEAQQDESSVRQEMRVAFNQLVVELRILQVQHAQRAEPGQCSGPHEPVAVSQREVPHRHDVVLQRVDIP